MLTTITLPIDQVKPYPGTYRRTLSAVAIAGGVTGAILMASTHLFALAFAAFLCSSVAAGIIRYTTPGQLPLACLDALYTCINIYWVAQWI